MVDIVDIHVIHLQAPQAVFDGMHNMHPRHPGIVRPRSYRVEKLGGHHRAPPPVLEGFSQEDFRRSVVVGVCGVKEIHARLQGQVHHPHRLCFIRAAPKRHRSQTKFRYLQPAASHSAIFHRCPPWPSFVCRCSVLPDALLYCCLFGSQNICLFCVCVWDVISRTADLTYKLVLTLGCTSFLPFYPVCQKLRSIMSINQQRLWIFEKAKLIRGCLPIRPYVG